MQYKVNILGKPYDLPALTIEVQEQIEAVGALAEEHNAGRITTRDVVWKTHAFVERFAPGAFPSAEEADINELNAAGIAIIETYTAPGRKAKNEADMMKIREVVNQPELKKLLDAIPAVVAASKK